MINLFKKVIIQAFRMCGLVIHKVKPEHYFPSQIAKILTTFDVKYVIDIGANEGQYASEIRRLGYKHSIYSVEPLTEAHNKLLKNSRSDCNWHAIDRCAVGSKTEKAEINVSSNSVSSSLLILEPDHLEACASSQIIGTEPVDIMSADDLVKKLDIKLKDTFIKLDVQGYELNVLKSFSRIDEFKGVQLECSFASLYKNAALYYDIIEFLEKNGFGCWAISQGFTDNKTGRTLQADLVYINKRFTGQYSEKAFSLLRRSEV